MSTLDLKAYGDASFANNLPSRASSSGYVYEVAQEMDREKLWIWIYFPRVPFRYPTTSRMTTNSPGILYLRRIYARHLIVG